MTSESSSSFDALCERYEECYQYLHDARRLLQRFEGVIGIGIGPKSTGDRLLPEHPCFLVYVQEKKPHTELDAKELIPKEVLGIRTDVVAIGSRAGAAHNEFDARWLEWYREGFVAICIPGGEGYHHAS